MSSGLERDLDALIGREPSPHSSFEPVGVAARYPPPPASIDPDASKGWLRRIWPMVAGRRTPLLVAVGSAVIALGAQVAAPRVIMAAVDDALIDSGTALAPFVWTLIGLAVVRGGFTWLQRANLFRFAYDLEADLRVLLYAHLGRMPFSFYDTVGSGELISRANSDVRAIQMFLSFAPLIMLHLGGLVMALALMLSVHGLLTLVAAAPLLGVLYAGWRMRYLLSPLSWLVQSRQAEVAGVVSENVSGVRIVRSFAAERQQLGALARVARRLRWASVRQLDVRAKYAPAIENLPRLAVVGVLAYGGWLVIQGQVTVGAIVAFAAYVGMLQAPFRMLGGLMLMAQRAAASAGRIYELFDTEPAIRDRAGAVELDSPRGDVAFHDVHFAYDGEPVVAGLNLTVSPGETVALVGRTGSGKSTVARLLARYYDVDAGQVLLDGHDVRDLTLPSLRAAVGVVFDEPFLFSGTLRDNLAYARPDASDEEIHAAARDAQAADFIAALPAGYDTVVGERGYTLSGGQRQRIALARALVADSPVLVLDDATSAIDAEVEQAIHAALAARSRERTTILITHRLSTIDAADRVVLLEGGVVAASGDHRELLATDRRYAAVLDRDPDRDAVQRGAP